MASALGTRVRGGRSDYCMCVGKAYTSGIFVD